MSIESDLAAKNAMAESAMLKAIDPSEPIGLRIRPTWCVGRTLNGWILLDGCGPLGVGQMWVRETEDYKKKVGYESAPILPDYIKLSYTEEALVSQAGWAAYKQAADAERERIIAARGNCPRCEGSGEPGMSHALSSWEREHWKCDSCLGTGSR